MGSEDRIQRDAGPPAPSDARLASGAAPGISGAAHSPHPPAGEPPPRDSPAILHLSVQARLLPGPVAPHGAAWATAPAATSARRGASAFAQASRP